jgi:hypothetical protein
VLNSALMTSAPAFTRDGPSVVDPILAGMYGHSDDATEGLTHGQWEEAAAFYRDMSQRTARTARTSEIDRSLAQSSYNTTSNGASSSSDSVSESW